MAVLPVYHAVRSRSVIRPTSRSFRAITATARNTTRSAAERAALQREIDYQTRELARVHRARDDIQHTLATHEGKKKRGPR